MSLLGRWAEAVNVRASPAPTVTVNTRQKPGLFEFVQRVRDRCFRHVRPSRNGSHEGERVSVCISDVR
jgi:hypothetical protein